MYLSAPAHPFASTLPPQRLLHVGSVDQLLMQPATLLLSPGTSFCPLVAFSPVPLPSLAPVHSTSGTPPWFLGWHYKLILHLDSHAATEIDLGLR